MTAPAETEQVTDRTDRGGDYPAGRRLAHRLTSRRGAWTALILGLLAAVALIGGLRGAEPPQSAGAPPASSESARVADLLAAQPGHDIQPVVLVVTRVDGGRLADADLAAAERMAAALPTPAGHPVSSARGSKDGLAAVIEAPTRVDASNTVNADTVTELRERIAQDRPSALQVQVTGGPAFGADLAKAFEGANVTLLLVTIGIVALLLLLTYRSPVLWLIPLAVVGIADQVAAVVAARVGAGANLGFDAGIVSVLVFGAGTNYALLLISRYREELRHTADHRGALVTALRRSAPAIVASNLTVVVSLLALLLAVIPSTRGLGLASGVGLLVALVVVLTLLPAALAVCGRRIFWPLIPRPVAGSAGAGDAVVGDAVVLDVEARADAPSGPFARVATGVLRRPAVVAAATLTLLVVLATGLIGTRIGLGTAERFRTPTESAAGLAVLGEHFPAGVAQPLLVLGRPGSTDAVARAVGRVPGAEIAGTDPAAGLVRVVTHAAPGTDAARDTVRAVRAIAHTVPEADALVGGGDAVALDTRDGFARDLRLVVPMVLGVSALVLLLLLRAPVAVLVLIPVNALSALAALGAGAWLGRHLLDWPALDLQVPLLAFLFLVALGIDYTIFLAHRARYEATRHGTRGGMARAVGATGGVITSAGVVLAAVFAALGVLPLVTLGQLGLIVGLGVLLDTLVVRTLLVPALAGLLGARLWWPARVQ